MDAFNHFLNKHSHNILLGWFLAVFVVILGAITEIPILDLSFAAATAFGSMLFLALAFDAYQRDADNLRIQEQQKQVDAEKEPEILLPGEVAGKTKTVPEEPLEPKSEAQMNGEEEIDQRIRIINQRRGK